MAARPFLWIRAMPQYRINTWFERDRAMVSLYDEDREVITFWDDDVRELIEDGFLDPKDWLGSAVEYVQHLGLIK